MLSAQVTHFWGQNVDDMSMVSYFVGSMKMDNRLIITILWSLLHLFNDLNSLVFCLLMLMIMLTMIVKMLTVIPPMIVLSDNWLLHDA